MYVYVARSIDRKNLKISQRVSANVRALESALVMDGHVTYRPDIAFRVPVKADNSAVYDVNAAALDRADAVAAFVTGDSVGVPAEVQRAIDAGKQVALIVADVLPEKSWHIYGWSSKPNVKLWTCAFHFGEQTDHDRALMAADISNWLSTRGGIGLAIDPGLWAKYKPWESGRIGVFGAPSIEEVVEAIQRHKTPPAPLRDPVVKFWADSAESNADIPTKAYPGDAGWDLTVSRNYLIRPGDFIDMSTGVHAELPVGTWGRICGRSSAIRSGLLVVEGVIDEGYRGELYIGVQNVGKKLMEVPAGTKLAQLIVIPRAKERAEIVEERDDLSASERGTNGFGSSGGTL